MLPAALCVSGFALRVPPLARFLSLPLPQPSTQEQSGLCQQREMTSGEGRVCLALHRTPATSYPHIRACGWKRIGVWRQAQGICLHSLPTSVFFFSYCPVFCLSSSCLLLALLFSVFPPLPLPGSPAPWAHPDTVSQLLCSFPCCRALAGWGLVDSSALGVETAHSAVDIGLGPE